MLHPVPNDMAGHSLTYASLKRLEDRKTFLATTCTPSAGETREDR